MSPSVVTPLLGKAAASAFGAALPHLLNPWTRSQVLKFMDEELRANVTPDQVTDLIGRVKHDALLRRIAGLRQVREVHQLVAQVVQPHGITDPQHAEALLLTRALLAALLRATSPNAHAGLTSSMLLDLYLAETLPELSTLIRLHRDRQARPVQAATRDLAEVLRRAGQSDLRLTVSADQSVSVSGVARLHLSISGANAERFELWRRGGHGASVRLPPSDGDVQLSYGHEDLDRLLLPNAPTGHVTYEFAEVPVRMVVRLRITAPDCPAAFCDAQFSYGPRSQVLELQFGDGDTFFSVTLTPRQGKLTNVRMNLTMETGNRLVPLAFRPTLRAMRLLARPDMQIILPAGTPLVRADGSETTALTDTVLFGGQIWNDEIRTDEPAIQEYLDGVAEIHLALLDIADALESWHGVDTEQLRVPEEWSEHALMMLGVIADVLHGRQVMPPVEVDFLVPDDAVNLMTGELHELVNVHLEALNAFDFGTCVLKLTSRIGQLRLADAAEDASGSRHMFGVLEGHAVNVLPSGSFAALMEEQQVTVRRDGDPVDLA